MILTKSQREQLAEIALSETLAIDEKNNESPGESAGEVYERLERRLSRRSEDIEDFEPYVRVAARKEAQRIYVERRKVLRRQLHQDLLDGVPETASGGTTQEEIVLACFARLERGDREMIGSLLHFVECPSIPRLANANRCSRQAMHRKARRRLMHFCDSCRAEVEYAR